MSDKTADLPARVIQTLEELGSDHFKSPAKLYDHGDASYALRYEV